MRPLRSLYTEVAFINHKLSLNGDESLSIDFIVSINIVHCACLHIFMSFLWIFEFLFFPRVRFFFSWREGRFSVAQTAKDGE